jgi:hypothetical protein
VLFNYFQKKNLIILFSIMTLNDVFITGYKVVLCIGSGLVAAYMTIFVFYLCGS